MCVKELNKKKFIIIYIIKLLKYILISRNFFNICVKVLKKNELIILIKLRCKWRRRIVGIIARYLKIFLK